MNLIEAVIESTHHAVCVISRDREQKAMEIEKIFLERVKTHHTHADMYFLDRKLLEVDDIRALIAWHNSFSGGEKCAIVSFHNATPYAQNAMLKLIEEPRRGVRFIFVVTQKGVLLSTVLSRVELYEDNSSVDVYANIAQEFLATRSQDRIELKEIKKLLDAKDDTDKKDREVVQQFLMALEVVLCEHKEVEQEYRMKLRKMISYIGDTGSSPKMIVEYVSLLVPQIS